MSECGNGTVERLLDALDDIVIQLGRGGQIEITNRATVRMLGREPKELKGIHILELFAPQDRPMVEEQFDLLSSHAIERFRQTAHVVPVEGEPLEVFVHAKRIDDDDSFVVTMTDATSQRESADQMAMAMKRESLGVMAGGIAHDFNNLLQSMMTSADILAHRFDEDDPDWEFIELIRESGRRMSDLTAQLRTFARGGSPKMSEVRLGNVLQEVLAGRRFQGESRVRVSVVVSRDLHIVRADINQMIQLFHNVASNAFEAIEESRGNLTIIGRNITVEEGDRLVARLGLEPGPYVEMIFSDDGEGIPKEDLKRIFDPFFTTKGLGSGMGLAAAQGIVQSHRGALDIESEVGMGTRLRIYLPAASS